MVQLYRTFCDYSFTGATRRAGHLQPERTFLNYIVTEVARYREVSYRRSGRVDRTEPSLPTSLQGMEGVQCVRCTSSMRIEQIEPHRTFSTYRFAKRASFVHKVCLMFYTPKWGGSSTPNLSEPSQPTSSQREQGL